MNGLYNIRVVRGNAEFYALRNIWNSLLGKTLSDTIFLSWEWSYTWWECFGEDKELFIIIVECGAEIIGIAPLCALKSSFFGLSPLKHLVFLGSVGVCTEYADFILWPGKEKELIYAILDFLYAKPGVDWDVLNLISMKEDALNLKNLMEYGSDRQIEYLIYDTRLSPYITLPGSMEEYVRSSSKKMRWKYKKYKQTLEDKFPVALHETKNADSVLDDFSAIKQLHQKRWNKLGGAGSFALSRREYLQFQSGFVQRAFEKGWLYLLSLKVNGEPVAGQYNFHYKRKIYQHSTGFNPDWEEYNIGSVLQFLALEDAIENKRAYEFDFLRGTEPYKYFWTKLNHTSVDVAIWRSKAINRRVTMERKLRKFGKLFVPKRLVEKVYEHFITLSKS